MRVAIIPARGGSKRIPRKNVKPFAGRPMIAWSISAAIDSGCFDRILVSSDDPEIIEIARAEGAEAPFVRPADISDDHATTVDVIAHALRWLEDDGQHATLGCCIYATSPMLTAEDLRAGLELISGSELDYVISATRYSYPIQRALTLDESQRVGMAQPEYIHTRSQDLPPRYHDAALFYWGTAGSWRQAKPVFTARTAAVLIPEHRCQDIDTPDDWIAAELKFAALRGSR